MPKMKGFNEAVLTSIKSGSFIRNLFSAADDNTVIADNTVKTTALLGLLLIGVAIEAMVEGISENNMFCGTVLITGAAIHFIFQRFLYNSMVKNDEELRNHKDIAIEMTTFSSKA